MRILVLGATGYIGRNVAAALVDAGHEVHGLVRTPDRASALPAGVSAMVGDIDHPETVTRLLAPVDAVINTGFSGHSGDWAEAVAAEHTLHETLVTTLAETGKTLIVSNGTVFLGDSGQGRHSETAPVLEGNPAAIRAASTEVARRGADHGIRVIELRLASFVYGQNGSVFLPKLIDAARRTGRSIYVGDGQVGVSAVHVEAAARAYVDVLSKGDSGEVFHIASDDEPTVRDIAEAIAIAAGDTCRAESVTAEKAAALIDPFTAMFLQTNNRLDSTKARAVLGWSGAHPHGLLWDVAHGSYGRRGSGT